jgi:hypothetical protein
MKKITTYVLMVLLLCSLTACSAVRSSSSIGAMLSSEEIPSSTASTVSQATSITGAVSVTDALAQNSETHEDPQDTVWDATSVIPILLNGNSIHVEGEGVSVDGSRATITSAGDYSLSGSLVDGQIIVDTQDKALVRLILNGVDISNSTSSAIYIKSAKETIIILADGTRNTLSDAGAYVFEDTQADEPNAALFSTSDLTIYGNGSLSVIGNTNDGIASKDGLILAGGEITVVALDDGIRGKDYLVIKSGAITVNAQGDGLKSDNAQDSTLGFISIEAGQINITAEGDAIEAETDVAIADGEFTIISGGGSQARLDQDTSGKGIKAAVSVTIDGGSFNIDAADDAIHSNGSIGINGGDFVISTGDDGLHADDSLTINGGGHPHHKVFRRVGKRPDHNQRRQFRNHCQRRWHQCGWRDGWLWQDSRHGRQADARRQPRSGLFCSNRGLYPVHQRRHYRHRSRGGWDRCQRSNRNDRWDRSGEWSYRDHERRPGL